MSYDISLVDPVTKETLEADFVHHITGGSYTIGGTRKLELNVTWNYCKFYYGDKAFGDKGIKSLDGMTGAESIPILKKSYFKPWRRCFPCILGCYRGKRKESFVRVARTCSN